MGADDEVADWLERLRRDSRIAMTAEGRLTYHGQPLQNERVEALFLAGLEVRDDGEVILRVGGQWCYVDCEDVPFFVVALSGCNAEQAGEVVLRSGEREPFAPEGLVWVGDERVYYHLADGRRARLLRSAVHDLGPLLEPDDAAEHGVSVRCGGERVPIRVERPPG